MTETKKTAREKFIEAEERGNHWLSLANEAAEQGMHEKAERLYTKGQFWLDRANALEGQR